MKQILPFITRLIGLPFFACLALIGVVVLFLKYLKNYLMYGGEAIAYTNKTQRKTIVDVFERLQKIQEIAP